MENRIKENTGETIGDIQISPEVENQVIQQWETIGISNDFVFCKVMQDTTLLSELIQIILPKLKFKELQVQSQQTVEIGADIHGVRFDIFVKLEDGSIVEIDYPDFQFIPINPTYDKNHAA